MDGGEPEGIEEGGEEDAGDGGIGAAKGGLGAAGAAEGLPERDGAGQQEERGKIDAQQADEGAEPAVGRLPGGGAEIGGEGKERAGERLRDAVTGDEGAVIDPAAARDLGLQQGQDDVAAAKDERAGAVEGAEIIETAKVGPGGDSGQQEEKQEKEEQGGGAADVAEGEGEGSGDGGNADAAVAGPAEEGAGNDDDDRGGAGGDQQHRHGGEEGHAEAGAVRAKLGCPLPRRLGRRRRRRRF